MSDVRGSHWGIARYFDLCVNFGYLIIHNALVATRCQEMTKGTMHEE